MNLVTSLRLPVPHQAHHGQRRAAGEDQRRRDEDRRGGEPGQDLRDGPAQIGPIIPYLLLVLVLIARPTGLLGNREA
jgi:hypothetical protein